MRKFFMTSMAFAAIMSAMTFTSCSDDETGGGGSALKGTELNGVVEGTLTLNAGTEYTLTGTLTVPAGATLEIPAGTTIKANQGFDKYILVAQGGRINARGTATSPVVFTANSDNAEPGYWGGLIINGYAPISGANSGTVGATEIDNNQPYGGTNADDNSGTLTYVEIHYSGARSSADIEHNGLTLNAVGRGTTINNIYIADGADDAIEFFGGSVDVTNLLAVNCDDDCFDFTQGYTGTLSNCYGLWESGFTSTESDPRGVEAAASQAMQDAIKVRRGAKATINNALVIGSGEIQELVDLTDGNGAGDEGSVINVTKNATNVGADTNDGNPAGATVNIEAGNTGADVTAFEWTGYQFAGAATADIPTEITTDLTLDASTQYYINGAVHVKEGGVLRIPAGMTVRAREGFGNYIIVERGGQIFAEGTEDAPITFTADVDDATQGYWGGIIINGRAVISGYGSGVHEGATEVDNNIAYGGDDNADNSGVLTYVRILYSGARSSADIEHNGLTLNAVGNGTTIENIYIAEGADDAIEFFGGSVNVSNLLAVNCDDDCFDFTQGYSGTLSNCYGRWESGFTSTESDPRGVEADGNLDGEGANHTPQADFRIENMTIENLSTTQPMQDAIKVRRLAKATIENALVIGSGEIQDIVDLTDSMDDADAGTVVNVTKGATNVGRDTNPDNPAGATVNIADGNAGCPTGIFGWTGYSL